MLRGMDILHDVTIGAARPQVWGAMTRPDGLNAWWTERCLGDPRYGAEYELVFGDAVWKAVVVECQYPEVVTWEVLEADEDWELTRFGVRLDELAGEEGASTRVRFSHRGWRHTGEHYRRTSYCWAQYLRLLKSYLEDGHLVTFEDRRF